MSESNELPPAIEIEKCVFDKQQIIDQYESCSSEKQQLLNDIEQIVIDSKAPLEGNAFYSHDTLNLYPDLYNKQLNLFWCGKQATTKICEIGFNAGHSTMLMLLGREKTPLDYTIFDISNHPYMNPCLKYIQSKFRHIKFEYVKGDSNLTMPSWIKANDTGVALYDIVHIDGGYADYCVYNDLKNADLIVKKGGFIIIDDTNVGYINNYVNSYLANGAYTELDVLKTKGYPHRIIQKNV
jgi:hypothetical protein